MLGYDSADIVVHNRLNLSNLKINFDYCHYGLSEALQHLECPPGKHPDFYIITDIEPVNNDIENGNIKLVLSLSNHV